MNYIYDIYLNLNNILFDFFDWNKNDKIIHVRKIPIFKVNEELLKKIIVSEFCRISIFLDEILKERSNIIFLYFWCLIISRICLIYSHFSASNGKFEDLR